MEEGIEGVLSSFAPRRASPDDRRVAGGSAVGARKAILTSTTDGLCSADYRFELCQDAAAVYVLARESRELRGRAVTPLRVLHAFSIGECASH